MVLIIALVMTPLGFAQAESNNNTVWENMNPTSSTSDKKTNDIQVNTEIGFGETFRIFASLVLVIGLIFVAFYFIKKHKNNSFNQNQLFENLGGFPLGNQRSLQVVRMDKRIFILGVSDSIQLIKEVDDPEEVREIIHKQSLTENHFATKFQKQLDLIKSNNKETVSKLLRKEQDDD